MIQADLSLDLLYVHGPTRGQKAAATRKRFSALLKSTNLHRDRREQAVLAPREAQLDLFNWAPEQAEASTEPSLQRGEWAEGGCSPNP